MSNIFNTKRVQGFTLIELLVVIAIIGLLSTIIAAPIQNARKKARDSKKIAELKAIQLAVEQYAESNLGNYPANLSLLAPTYMPILPAAGATTSTQVAPRDKYAYVPYNASGTAVQAGGVTFGYHLGAHLESYAQALDSDRDCLGASTDSDFVDGATVASTTMKTCTFYPSSGAEVFGSYSTANNYQSGMMEATGTALSVTGWNVGANSRDFTGADRATSTCNSLTDCVFDITGQI